MNGFRFNVSFWVTVTVCILSAIECRAVDENDPSYWNQQAHDLLFEKKDYTMQKVVSSPVVCLVWANYVHVCAQEFNIFYICRFGGGNQIRV